MLQFVADEYVSSEGLVLRNRVSLPSRVGGEVRLYQIFVLLSTCWLAGTARMLQQLRDDLAGAIINVISGESLRLWMVAKGLKQT